MILCYSLFQSSSVNDLVKNSLDKLMNAKFIMDYSKTNILWGNAISFDLYITEMEDKLSFVMHLSFSHCNNQ